MNRRSLYFSTAWAVVWLLSACHSTFIPQRASYQLQKIEATASKDSSLLALIKPYGDSVRIKMDQVVGMVEGTLEKTSPESTLGNFMADAYLAMARRSFTQPVDAAMVNYGGIRLTQLTAGPITRGKVFELMPFDNLLVIQQLTGAQLQALLDLVAARGGWPVAGLTMQIKDKKAVAVTVSGKPLDLTKKYWIANSDFIASGGDNAIMLKELPQIGQGYLVRDVLFDYIRTFTVQGKAISATLEKRVSYAQ